MDITTLALAKKASVAASAEALAAAKAYTDEKSDLTQIAGYDATKTQTLKNVTGTLTWVDN